MEEAIELSRSKDTKVRMAGVERLHQLLESSRKPLSSSEVTSVVDTCLDLLKDNNFRVSQGGLLALASAAVVSGDHLKIHLNSVVPAAVDRLGDSKQPVRDAARRLLVTLMQVSSPTIIVERAGSYAWEHKSWRVREEFARTVTSAINLFASTELPLQRAILPPILHMLNDPNVSVRDAAISCIEEMYTQIGPQFKDELSRHQLPSYLIKDINARLERIEPKPRSSDGAVHFKAASEHKLSNINHKRSSPKAKNSSRESSLFGGDGDVTDIPVESVKVYSDKELVREIEKIAAILVPEKDWSLRIGAMQRVEGLVLGGAIDYPSFRGLLKQLVGPLCTQLSDRRSSIVKQACHLLNFLSKELLGDFEACAEQFIPVLFKLVVITVLVIAESADNCIKTMLRNCKVARVLPRIADCAKNDKNAALRSRCCDYALLILENWPDEPEIQRAADLYEDLIRRCVGDAVSEVRTIARACYRMFARTWPERSRRLFQSFDPVIQRIINEEDGGLHRRHASPLVRERNISSTAQSSVSLNLPGYGTSAIVAMDKSATLAPRASVSSGMLLSSKSLDKGTDGRLESVLNSSKEKVSAIENLLKGLDISSQHNSSSVRSSSLDLEVDPPSSRDPPFPFAVPASNQVTSLSLDSKLSTANGSSHHNGSLALSNMFSRTNASKDAGNFSYRGSRTSEPLSAVSSYSANRGAERGQERSLIEELTNIRDARRQVNSHMEKQLVDMPYRDLNHRESQASYVPNFQRPLSRNNVTGRSISSSRRSFDDSHLHLGKVPSYTDSPLSLHDALSEGLSSTSDWSARVAAFNCIRSLLQQGAGGIQEIVQSFEKVMKLFFKHLDDPHHKVAQSALLALADIVPSCRKPFESYVERILPHVFSRLVDPKELVRQPCTATLEIVSKTYGVDSLLPALLRSLDEQRSPKAKLAVIDFAIGSFKKHSATPEGAANHGILNLWLAKLTPLVHDKNTKLKEAATSCIISVYTYYDPTGVLNFILNLTVEEQNSLRRALKQYTPRIEVDLMNYLQSKKERQRSKTSYDPSDIVGTSSEEGYGGMSKKSQYFGRSPGNSFDRDGGRKWKSTTEPTQVNYWSSQASADETQDLQHESFDTGSRNEIASSRIKDRKYLGNHTDDSLGSWKNRLECADTCEDINDKSTPHLDTNGPKSSENTEVTSSFQLENEISNDVFTNPSTLGALKITPVSGTGPSIPTILHLISNGNEGSPASSKYAALRQLIDASVSNDPSVWDKYFNQILTTVLEVLDDSDSSVRELSLLLIAEMLKFQKDSIEDSVEIVLEKLLHISKDTAPKVANVTENCLTTLLAQYDPLKCLNVIAPLLVMEDEKILVTSINCLAKLVGRFSPEELTAQLPSFLPAIFDAFGNQSADVRKTVVFCLVDIYIMLGKAFMPYLEGLNSTQLRLVTIYANRISQARTGTPIDATQ